MPFSIQRIYLKADRAKKELEKVRQGDLLLFPRQEFEDRLERLQKAHQARAEKPHLIEARYSAELIDRAFTNGTIQWTVLHSGSAVSILPIEPFNLALSKAIWEQGGEAILAELDGKSLGLLVKHTGKSTCLCDWSAGGAATSDGIAFSLAVPPCVLSTFDFTLPADRWLAVKSGAVVTGPHETGSPSKRLWKMQVTGGKSIDVLVRKLTEAKGPKATVFARVHTTQQLTPDRLAVEHDFHLDIVHGSVRELTFDGDAGLQPYAVVWPGGDVKDFKWEETAPAKDAKGKSSAVAPGVLTIALDEPMQGKIQGLRVRSLLTRPTTGLWTSPALRLRGAQPRGETIEVRMHPAMPVGKWDHGTFQPTGIATDADGVQRFVLAENAVDTATSRRPSMLLPVKGLDLHTTEHYRWHITQRGAILTADIQYAPARGQLFELRLKLPKTFPAYQIESVATEPADLLGGWHPGADFLVVALKQPLVAGKRATLKVQMRSAFRELTTGFRMLNFPDLEPLDAARREGKIAMVVDPIFRPQLEFASAPLAPADEADRVKDASRPSFRFEFRDKQPTAALRLVPQPVQVHLQGKHTVILSEQKASLQYRWDVQPLVGAPEFLDFRLAPGFPTSWRISAAETAPKIHHWERLHLQEALPHLLPFANPLGMHAAALEASLPGGTYWRFHLSEPLQKKASFTLEATAPAGMLEDQWRRISLLMPSAQMWECVGGALTADAFPGRSADRVWSIPLMTPVQLSNAEQEITVESAIEPISKMTADGALRLQNEPPPTVKATTRLQLHQAADRPLGPAPALTLWTRAEKRTASQLEYCDAASVATLVCRDGRVYHHIEFRLWHWRDRKFDMQFPPASQILAVQVHDRPLERPAVNDVNGSVRLTLPFDQNADFVKYDILVRAPSGRSLFSGLMNVPAPRVAWPAPPLEIQTRFALEDGWTPLLQESFERRGVPVRLAKQTETPRRLRQVWNWGHSWWPYGEQAALREQLDRQKQRVLAAEANLRAGAGKSIPLGDAIDRLARQHLKDQAPLVVDMVALRALDLTPQSRVLVSGRPFWESVGLVYLPCPSGALLTSARRLQRLGIDGPLQAVELDDSIQEAIRHGRDASGGFCLAVAWLNLPALKTPAFSFESVLGSREQGPDSLEWTEWQSRTDGAADVDFYIVDPVLARIFGWLIAALVALVLLRLQHSATPATFFRVNVFLEALGLLAVIWSPLTIQEFLALPVFIAVSVSFLWCVLRLVGRGRDQTEHAHSTVSHHKPAAGAVAVILLLGMGWNVTGQPAGPRTYPVYLIDGPEPVVLVTPDLAAKLDELEKQPAFGASGAALVSAKYAGKVKNDQAAFDVQYEIYTFQDKATLLVPLKGVQLSPNAFLDGAPVFPAPHKDGYTVPIQGKGSHHLRLSFTDRAVVEGDQLQLSFKIPRLPQNEITLQWQAPVLAVHCQHAYGEEKTVVEPSKAVKQWHAQLGYERSLDLRWTSSVPGPAAKAIDVREAHFWDLRPGSLALTTSLNYAIGKAGLTQVVVLMPEGLQVRAVDAVPAVPTTPVTVKAWNILGVGDQRRLVVDFVQPITGNVTLNLDIVPQPFGQKTTRRLALPAPVQGVTKTGLLGYRLDRAEVGSSALNLSVQAITPDEFEKQWSKQIAQPLPVATRAYTFQRKGQKAWLEPKVEPSDQQAQLQLVWNLDRQRADVQGKVTLTSAQEDLIFLEFFIDRALTLGTVAGPDVHRWHLHESTLQVWLRQPMKKTSLTLTGWRSTPVKAAGPLFTLPVIYPVQMQIAAATLEVRPAAGLSFKFEALNAMRLKPGEKHQFLIDKMPYGATFRLLPEALPPEASMLTKVHRTEQGIEFEHSIRLTTQRGQLPPIKLHVKDWPHGPLLPDAPGAQIQILKTKGSQTPGWTLAYPPGLPQEVFITLRTRVAKEKLPSFLLPVIELEGAKVTDRWLAWQDVEIEAMGSKKTGAPDRSIKDALAPYEKNGWFKDVLSWKLARADGTLRASLPKTPTRTSVRVLASSEFARPAGQGRWLHESAYWIHVSEATEVRAKFPAAVEMLSVWIDGRLYSVVHPATQDYSLSLEAGSQPRLVELRWQFPTRTEPMAAPFLTMAQLDPLGLPAHQRLVWVPDSLTAASDVVSSETLVRRLLHEASGHMQITAALAQESTISAEIMKQLAARQLSFHACMREAEYALLILNEGAPDSARWRTRLDDLNRQNTALALKHHYDDQRKAAKKAKGTSAGPRAYVWAWSADRTQFSSLAAGVPVILAPAQPGVALQSEPAREAASRSTRSYLFVLVAIFLFLFSCFRRGWALLRIVSPEFAIALSAGAMWLFGLSLFGAFVIGMMILVRVLWLARTLRQHFTAAPPAVEDEKPPEAQPPPAT